MERKLYLARIRTKQNKGRENFILLELEQNGIKGGKT